MPKDQQDKVASKRVELMILEIRRAKPLTLPKIFGLMLKVGVGSLPPGRGDLGSMSS